MEKKKIFAGSCELNVSDAPVKGGYVELEGETCYRIQNHDRMAPFFMSVVSDSNHWMFVFSNGALTCGRRNPEGALFPYYTDDKILDSADTTGSKTIIRIEGDEGDSLWEPFSNRYGCIYDIERNIYKNIPGNKLVFEEINRSLNVVFRYAWMSSGQYGFVRKSTLSNMGGKALKLRFVDGLQNLLPSNVDRSMQSGFSTLVDAYKKSELLDSGVGVFSLSSVPVDRAEPSESLSANTVWSSGIKNAIHLLSVRQLDRFCRGEAIETETDVHGMRCAFFVHSEIELDADESSSWYLVAEVDQDACAVSGLDHAKPSVAELLKDVEQGTENLWSITAQADGIQTGGDPLQAARHFSNTLFNIMRGGIFNNGYEVEKGDLIDFIETANKPLAETLEFDGLTDRFLYLEGLSFFQALDHPDAERLYLEYLPLTFSRRHGDPSRPWNMFSIETRNPDGSKKLSYQGNWRDIFQNWEALGLSYPAFFEGMICKFVNASTADGYNPYRIMREGVDWELYDPDDPWSNIGYWGDHQIIYLLKLLEHSDDFYPGKLQSFLDREIFVYADVPYRIKPYDSLLANPYDSVEFDDDAHNAIMTLCDTIGSDGRLLRLRDGEIYSVNLTEKLLVPLLAKLANFIPEAGIWMNTQRPEWNDANNALVGCGVSMVTLYHIRRYLSFCIALFGTCCMKRFALSAEVFDLFRSMFNALEQHKGLLPEGFGPRMRRSLLDLLGGAAGDYRETIYNAGFSGEKKDLSCDDLMLFLNLMLEYVDASINANRREDGLYHAYNLMEIDADGGISIRYLYEMLEGQAAVLSSGKLDCAESLEVLTALRSSSLYLADQHSYMLYPHRKLARFTQKNCIPDHVLPSIDSHFVSKDWKGGLHFNPQFRNAGILGEAMRKRGCSMDERKEIAAVYEQVFDHQSFTGRSGTFFKYEGLGCIYWHMVSKLLLAVQEICIKAKAEGADELKALAVCYDDIRRGIGACKSVEEQGAFPADPYSHTPSMMGAQQPGLTGQVKEDFIARLYELGIRIENGCLSFDPFLSSEDDIEFTFCTVPIRMKKGAAEKLCVIYSNGEIRERRTLAMDAADSAEIFSRTGRIKCIEITLK